MADFSIPSYRLPSEQPRGFSPNVNIDAPAAAFGSTGAQQLQIAGANLERTASNLDQMVMREAAIANETRVEGDVNTFVEQKQKALTDFVQLRGKAAIDAAPGINKTLMDLKKGLQAGVANDMQRVLLSRRLDAQFFEATGTINAHVAQQSLNWQKDTAIASGSLMDKQGVMDRNDIGKIDGLLAAKATIGIERARVEHGAPPDSDVAKSMVLDEQSKFLVGVLQAKIDDGNKRAALALYEKYGDILKRNSTVSTAMKGVRTEIDIENAANRAFAKYGLPQIRNGGETPLPAGVEMRRPQIEKAATSAGVEPALVAGVMAQESRGVDSAMSPAGARGPMQLMPGTAKDLGVTNPHDAMQAVPAGARYLRQQLDRYGGNEQLALMAYNWGPGNVDNWIKAGSDPAKMPAETRDYVTKVQGYAAGFAPAGRGAFKGDLKAGYQQAAADLQNDTGLPREIRDGAISLVNKTGANVTAFRDASLKSLQDEADSYRVRSYLGPTGPDPMKLGEFAARAEALGNQSLAETYRIYAAIAPHLKNGLQSAPQDTLKLLKSLEEGPAKKLLEGMGVGSDTEALARANDQFDKLQKRQANGLAFTVDDVKKAAQSFADLGKGEKAREVGEWGAAVLQSNEVLKLPPAQQQQAMQELRDIAARGEATGQQVVLADELRKYIAVQETAFAKDPYAAGQRMLGLPQLPLEDGAGRAHQAAQISSKRGGATIPPVSETEFGQWRTQLQNGTPDAAAKLLQSIALNYPPSTFRALGAGLAGKPDVSDPVSRGYAAAFAMFAERDPARAMLAREVLDGVQWRKDGGGTFKELSKQSTAVQTVIKNKLTDAFVEARGVPSIIVDAAESLYYSRMIRAGRGNDALDADVLGGAIEALVGKAIRGQSFLPPRGVDAYQIDSALKSLSAGDVVGLRTLNGSEVTAEKIARYGLLFNATDDEGGEGRYWVKIPDPAQNFAPGVVTKPDGTPWTLDIRPLLERVQRFPNLAAPRGGQTSAAPLMRHEDYSNRNRTEGSR